MCAKCVYELNGEWYCKSCLPDGANEEDVTMISSLDELETPPVCTVCGREHDYMSILWYKCIVCGEWCAPDEKSKCHAIPAYKHRGPFNEGTGFQNHWSPFRTICNICFPTIRWDAHQSTLIDGEKLVIHQEAGQELPTVDSE